MKKSRLSASVLVLFYVCAAGPVHGEEGLVAHWPLNEGKGIVATDISGGGNHGRIIGARWDKDGERNALRFDGENDYILVGKPAALDIRGPVTLSAWVFLDALPDAEVCVLGKGWYSYTLNAYKSGTAWFYIGSNGNSVSADLLPGAWRHVAGVFDEKRLAIYVDGKMAAEKPSKFAKPARGEDFFIGTRGGAGYLKGMIADARVYARALAGTEVEAQFKAGRTKKPAAIPSAKRTAEPVLVAHYPLNEGKGAIARDASGNGNHGRIQGAQWARLGKIHVLAFDGINDLISCGSPPALDLRGPMTMSVWFQPAEGATTEVGLCGKHFSSYLITNYKLNSSYWYIRDGGNNAGFRGSVDPGAWQQLAGTFDGRTLRLYKNGRLVAEKLSKFSSIPAGGDFFIGCVKGDPNAKDPNLRRTDFFKGMMADVKVYAGALTAEEILADFNAGSKKLLALEPVEVRAIRRGPTSSDGRVTVRVGPKGGMQVSAADGFFVVDSTFSYPGERIGYNALSEEPHRVESRWSPAVGESKPGNAIRINARGSRYRLRRVVSVQNETVTVKDTLKNLTPEPVGILIKHRVTVPEVIRNPRLSQSTEDPIVFLRQSSFDLGVLGEDALSRAYFSPFVAANHAGFRIEHFALDGGKEHTFVWKLYLLKSSGDEFAFINKVRRDWRSNHTLLGATYFFQVGSPRLADPLALKKYLRRHHVKVVMLSPWLEYDPGSYLDRPVTRAEYKPMMRKAAKLIKSVDPEIKCVGNIETDWVGLFPDKIRDGDKLPNAVTHGRGCPWIGPEHIRILENARLPWLDSAVRSPEGKIRLECYFRANKPQTALHVYLAPGNYHAQFLLDQARFICEEVGLDGVYVDEFNCDWLKSYGTWDGHSVDIDAATGEIVRRYTDCNVAGIKPRLDLINYILSKGIMVANTYPSTTEENALPVMRFAEGFSFFDLARMPPGKKPPFVPFLGTSQFTTPIGLGVTRPKDRVAGAEELMRGIIVYLRHGMVYYHYAYGEIPETGPGSGEYGPINHMFPTTPVRLFEGGIVGKERTITCVSGIYAWNHERPPHIFLFDEVGRDRKHNFRPVKTDAGWKVAIKLGDWQEIAVIE